MIKNEEEIIADLLKAEVIGMNKPNIPINPNHEAIRKTVLDHCGSWYDDRDDLIQRIDVVLYCFLTANVELGIYFVYLYLVTFEVDDVTAKISGEEEIKRMMVFLKEQDCPGNTISEKLLLALFDTGIKANVSKELRDQMYNGLIDCYIATQRARKFMNDLVKVSREEYLIKRGTDLFMNVCDVMARMESGLVLTQELKNDHNYKQFIKYVYRYGFIPNDLFSLKKEVMDSEWKWNYVYIVMKDMNLSAQESMNFIVKELSEIEAYFQRYGERLKERNDKALSHYVDTVPIRLSKLPR